jgi:TM2 domain-containing membrane protein YozV
MKSKATAYLIWLFLGGLGTHAFYCRKTQWAIFTLVTYFFGLLFLAFDGGFMLFLHVLNVLFQAFLIPSWVNEANKKEAKRQADLIAEGIRKARGENV